MVSFIAPLKVWTGTDGSSRFLIVPASLAGEIKAHALLLPRGFGSVRVAVTIDDVTWRTSLFPSKGQASYFLPVKIEICRKLGLVEGDPVEVSLELL